MPLHRLICAVLLILPSLASFAAPQHGQLSSSVWLADGRAAILAPDSSGGLELRHSSNAHPRTIADFQQPLVLFGPGGKIAPAKPSSALLAADGNTLQVFFSLDGMLQVAAAIQPVTPQSQWVTYRQPLAGTVRLQLMGNPRAAPPAVLVLQHEPGKTGSNLHRASVKDKALQIPLLVPAPDYVAGADALLDAQGRVHLAWSEAAPEQPVKYRTFDDAGNAQGEGLAFLGGGQHPAVAAQGADILIASEDVTGGTEVRWLRKGKIVRSEELGGRMHFRPRFARDAHGVIWLFALDADRRALWYRRLLGRDFGAENVAYGVQGRWVHDFAYTLAPQLRDAEPGFALLHHEDLPEGGASRHQFDLLPVPHLSVNDARRVLFLDLLDVAEVDHAVQRLGIATKYDQNPLKLNGPAGSPDEAWAGYADVMFDEGKFRMWYTTNTNTFERNWNLAYAESADGLNWTKPSLGLVPFNGSKANNLMFPNFKDPALPPAGANSAVGLVVRDDTDPDPGRRYKMMMMSSNLEGDANIYLTWSPDGIHWDLKLKRLWGKSPGPNQVIRGQTPWVEPLYSFFRDPLDPRPDYRWKLYGIDGYSGHPHMDVSAARSMGLVHGATPYAFTPYPANPLIDPRTGIDEDQNHGGLVQVYEGTYLGIYQHWSGPDWNVDLRLAASRDGIHFTRILPDQPLLPRGPLGAWDSGMLCTPNSLIARDDRLWLYYRGSPGTLATGRALSRSDYPEAKRLREPLRISTGLARLRRDGFAYLTVAPLRRAGSDHRTNFITDYQGPLEARVRSIPIAATGIGARTLHVNAGSLAPRFAWVKAQLLDADTGQAIPGHAFADCDPLDEDSLDHTFTWQGSPSLASVKAARIQVELLLFGTLESPQLYSFWFQ
ncbi:MAG: hypothetical protein JNG83_01630 [Opitutaceae bacterium]|nr:hypothetical protein [Opitutaceae bacterium]